MEDPKHPGGTWLSGDGGWRGEVAVGTAAAGDSQAMHMLARGRAPGIGYGPPKKQPLRNFFSYMNFSPPIVTHTL